jgi:hypothetical protein
MNPALHYPTASLPVTTTTTWISSHMPTTPDSIKLITHTVTNHSHGRMTLTLTVSAKISFELFDMMTDGSSAGEVIVLEAAYRLHMRHSLTYDEIERSNVLPLKLRSQFDKSGLLSTGRRRWVERIFSFNAALTRHHEVTVCGGPEVPFRHRMYSRRALNQPVQISVVVS